MRFFLAGKVQHRAFEPGRGHQVGQHPGRHRAVAERPSVGVPGRDRGMQLAVVPGGTVGPGQPERREQCRGRRVGPRIREQRDPRLPPGHLDGDAQVHQRGAAGEVHRAAARIAVAKHPGRIGIQLYFLAGPPDPEPPRLGVVHRGRQCGRVQQPGDHVLGRKAEPGRWRGYICLPHTPSVAAQPRRQ